MCVVCWTKNGDIAFYRKHYETFISLDAFRIGKAYHNILVTQRRVLTASHEVKTSFTYLNAALLS